jgi:hypothetical protein
MESKWNSPPPSNKLESTNMSLTLASRTGCTLDLDLGNSSDFYTAGGEIWSGINNISTALRGEYDGYGTRRFKATIYGCNENEMLISATRGDFLGYDNITNFTMAGQACQNTYYTGYSTATVTLGQGQSLVEIDEAQYQSNRAPISARVANTTAFDNVFFDANWTVHLNAKKFSASSPEAGFYYSTGPANLLAPLYDFSPEQIIADPLIGGNMERVRRRFFAEVLRDTFDLMATKDAVETTGSVLTTTRRVIVVSPIAIALEVIILVQAVLLAAVLYLTRPSRRPLGLTEDPAPVMSVARLISHDPSTVMVFAKSSNGVTNALEEPLSKFHFTLAEHQVHTTSVATPDTEGEIRELVGQPTDAKKKPEPFSLWLIALLFIVLALALIAIANLYHYSKVRGLYQTFFVYSFGFSVGGYNVGEVNPASLITTLVAVLIGLFWGSFDTTLRNVQPYLALAEAPVSGYKGVAVSYQSSYLLKAAFRAMRRSHWVLFLITIGAFLAQIRKYHEILSL